MENKVNKILRIIKDSYDELRNPYYQGVSGQLAFFLFLSLLPMVTLFSSFLGVFSLSLEGVQSWANINLTSIGMENLESLFIEGSDQTIAGNLLSKAVMVLTIIWSASKAQFSLTGITDYIYNDGESTGRNFIQRRGRSFVMVLVVLITLVVALAVLVYLPKLIHLLFGETWAAAFAETLLSKLRWLLVLALYFMTISWVYYLAPSTRIPYKRVIPGSIFASVGFIAVSYAYSLYVKFSSGNNVVYGSLANIVVLLIWFWFMSWVIILGIILNKECSSLR